MPISLTLSNPTEIVRSGATLVWTDLASSLGSDDAWATQPGFVPGARGKLLRYDVVPSAPFEARPDVAYVSIERHIESTTPYCTFVACDYAAIGTAADGPLWATAVPSPHYAPYATDEPFEFVLITTDLDVAVLNAGGYCLFLGFKAIPEDANAYSAANWTVAVIGEGTTSYQSGAGSGGGAWAGSGPWAFDTGSNRPTFATGTTEGVATARATTTLVDPPPYVVIEVTTTVSATGSSVGAPPPAIDIVLDNGQGQTFDGTSPSGVAVTRTSAGRHQASPSGGNYDAPVTLSAHSRADAIACRAYGSASASGTVVDPSSSTLFLDDVTLNATDPGGGHGGGLPAAASVGRMVRFPDNSVRPFFTRIKKR